MAKEGTEKSAKKRIRALCIQYDPNMKEYAARLEDGMNALIEDGYDVRVDEQANGVVLVGTLLETRSSEDGPSIFGIALPSSLREYLRGHSSEQDALTSRSLEILDRLRPIAKEYRDVEGIKTEATKRASSLFQGFNAMELSTAADEFERVATSHEKNHGSDSPCTYPELMRAIASVLKETAKTSLQ